jgi:hypothetical protein|tara:strand:- start:1927 stop:2175 length:249 start_codon:yes stop_codon:yes gene_type:complete
MGNSKSYIYEKTHMPYKGWLQGCFLCGDITGFTEIFTGEKLPTHILYFVYICKPCQNNKKNNIKLTNMYENKVLDWILTHTG